METINTAILPSTYFGCIQWYQKLNRIPTCFVEQFDHYAKQTYRNRCLIATTQGIQSLSIPIERYDGLKCLTKDIRISDHANWRHVHWNALQSAYGESPFFEYYADDLQPFFARKWDFLHDFNMEITLKMCELLDIQPHIQHTTAYLSTEEWQNNTLQLIDYREAIHPKKPLPDPYFQPKQYYQVYQQKWGFLPNLSILDLLMNMGNEAVLYL